MPYYTLKHCFICYKEADDDNLQELSNSPKSLSSNNNGEICRRFCTLASRYLHLDPYHFKPTETINTKRSYCFDRVCDECVSMLSSFAELYEQCEYLKLQLRWRALEISQVMKLADQEGKDRKVLEEKLNKMGSANDAEEIDDFRSDFISSIETETKTSFPCLQVKKLDQLHPDKGPDKGPNEGSNEDPDFIRITPIKRKKEKKTPNRILESRKSSRETRSSPKEIQTAKASSSASSDSESEDFSSVEQEQSEEPAPKKACKNLEYSCPVHSCGLKFNTMTRMIVHQQATGHNSNAVITINSKS